MKTDFENAGLISANVGIFSKSEKNGDISYGEGGSGVIIDRSGDDYFALTCAHVVCNKDAQILVFTVHTELKTASLPGMKGFSALTQETYEAMYKADVEYVSDRNDLAVIRFSADENLAVAEIAETDPLKEDRILCVGNPENEYFALSFGTVTSGVGSFGEVKEFPSNAMRHSAYINVGSSGGGAFNEQMQLVGVTPGASFSPFGNGFRFGVLIPPSEIRQCLSAWERRQN